MSHFIAKCSECDEVISQCRCMCCTKTVRYTICAKCRKILRASLTRWEIKISED